MYLESAEQIYNRLVEYIRYTFETVCHDSPYAQDSFLSPYRMIEILGDYAEYKHRFDQKLNDDLTFHNNLFGSILKGIANDSEER